jgi:hypothetical protein
VGSSWAAGLGCVAGMFALLAGHCECRPDVAVGAGGWRGAWPATRSPTLQDAVCLGRSVTRLPRHRYSAAYVVAVMARLVPDVVVCPASSPFPR